MKTKEEKPAKFEGASEEAMSSGEIMIFTSAKS